MQNSIKIGGYDFKVQTAKFPDQISRAAVIRLLKLVSPEKLPKDKVFDVTAWLERE